MPRLRSRSRPLIKCAYEPCPIAFRKWQRRRFCSDRCRKNEWRSRHIPYYAKLRQEWRDRQKQTRRQARRFAWVQEGREEEVPDRLAIEEQLAQASPQAVKEIQKILGQEPMDSVSGPASQPPPAG